MMRGGVTNHVDTPHGIFIPDLGDVWCLLENAIYYFQSTLVKSKIPAYFPCLENK